MDIDKIKQLHKIVPLRGHVVNPLIINCKFGVSKDFVRNQNPILFPRMFQVDGILVIRVKLAIPKGNVGIK